MVNSTSEGDIKSVIDKDDYLTLNRQQLEELSTSGFSEESRSLKESIKKRLTARVIPMTRDRKSHIENTKGIFSGNLQKGPSSGRALVQPSGFDSTIIERRESVIKTEKADIPVSIKAARDLEKVNCRKHKICEDNHLEPQSKHIRTCSPSSLPQQNSK